MDVGSPVPCAITTYLDSCIAYAETFDTRMWNGWDGGRSIKPWAVNVIWRVLWNMLCSMVLIPEAAVVTKTHCLQCGLSTVCRAVWIGCWFVPSLKESLPRDAAAYDVIIQICWFCCVSEKIFIWLESHRTTLRLVRKLPHLKPSIRDVPWTI